MKVIYKSLFFSNIRRVQGDQTCEFRDRTPTAMTMSSDVIEKFLVFFRRPKAFSQLLLKTTRMSSHFLLTRVMKKQEAKDRTER